VGGAGGGGAWFFSGSCLFAVLLWGLVIWCRVGVLVWSLYVWFSCSGGLLLSDVGRFGSGGCVLLGLRGLYRCSWTWCVVLRGVLLSVVWSAGWLAICGDIWGAWVAFLFCFTCGVTGGCYVWGLWVKWGGVRICLGRGVV